MQEQRPVGDGGVTAIKEEVQQDLGDSAAQPQVCLTSQNACLYHCCSSLYRSVSVLLPSESCQHCGVLHLA